MSDQSEKLANFISITDVDEERARFFLESAAWNLDMALASFYDDDSAGGDIVEPAPAAPTEPSQPPPRQTPASRFATLGSLRTEEESGSDEEGQAFYAGGSERGAGQQILGPPKKKNTDQLVKDMFKAAQEHGAETVESDPTPSHPRPTSAFRGSAYRLGDTEETSERVSGPPSRPTAPQVDVVLKMWRDGFSVDSGPLRAYTDPANQDFLSSIKRGEVPNELLRSARGGEVNLNMEDHRHEEFVQPKVTLKPFTGEGMRLGSPSGGVASTQAPPSASQAPPSSQPTLQIDSSQPVTSLQIRLSDGTRMVAKFNHSHTVSDVRSHIIQCHPQFASVNFVLMTTFPNKELTDDSQTLQDANLINAVLVQRVK